MNLKKFTLLNALCAIPHLRDYLTGLIDKRTWIVFPFFAVIIFFVFRDLFNSYFEADEWFHFTYYLPLTRQPDGFLTALVSTIINTGPLSGGQHVSPIATAIFFLNTKFFGISFPPYAFMTLLFHAINSFLVFLLIRTLLYKKESLTKNVFGILGSVFFALAPAPMHTVTGAAAFYSYNVLSVTFFLLCILFFKLAFVKKIKKYIYFSILFLFLALLTKETAVFLFLLLPFMIFLEKRIFSLKFLGKLLVFCLIVYAIFRFLVPNVYEGVGPLVDRLKGNVDRLIGDYVSSSLPSWQKQPRQEQETMAKDTGTIVSTDLSIHKNLPGEILFRSLTFPVKMTGTLFLPRQTVFSIVNFITPIVQPVPPGGDSADSSQARLTFLYGPGNGFIIYIASLSILIFCLRQILRFINQKQIKDAQALSTGLAIIILGALPLVAIIFSFPRWGYDFYFDSRHYYNPSVGAAIVFPFLIFGIAGFVSRSFRKKTAVPLIAFILFTLWLINNIIVLKGDIRQFTRNFQPDRREVVSQLKQYLPSLPKITVFYIETDGLSAYGPILPFQTSVPQALTVVYYDRSPLPDSFYDKPLFNGKGQGYMYSDGRGFGYYLSKKNLAEDLVRGEFEIPDIYGFFYEAKKIKVNDTTSKIRSEMQDYLKDAKENSDWEFFSDPSINISFLYPPQTIVEQDSKSTIQTFILNNPSFQAEILILNTSAGFSLDEYVSIASKGKAGIVNSRKVSYDRFHYNDAIFIDDNGFSQYLIKFDNQLVILETQNINQDLVSIIEKIAGSLAVKKQ